MKTPDGKECKYYFADYFRGRSTQDCRLIAANPASESWKPALCQGCPVPDILEANGSVNLGLKARVVKGMLGLVQKVEVTAYCREHHVAIPDPKKGCDLCRLRTEQLVGRAKT